MNASLSIKENELQDKAEPLQEGYGGLCLCDKPKALTVSLRWVALVYQHILILPLLSLVVSQFDFLCKCVCGMARSGWWTTAQDVPAWHPHEGIQRLHEGSQNTWCSSGGHFVSVCVCVCCMPWHAMATWCCQQDARKLWKDSSLRMCGSPCVLHLVVCLHVFAMVHLRAIIQDLPESEKKKRRWCLRWTPIFSNRHNVSIIHFQNKNLRSSRHQVSKPLPWPFRMCSCLSMCGACLCTRKTSWWKRGTGLPLEVHQVSMCMYILCADEGSVAILWKRSI